MYFPPAFYENTSKRRKIEYFMVLCHEKGGLSIKRCELKSAKVAFNQYIAQNKIDEALKLCLKYESLWEYSVISVLFEKEQMINDKDLLEDSRFDQIMNKVKMNTHIHIYIYIK